MKKKIVAITLCIAMLAIMIVSGTMAYFTDNAAQTNTFTAGKVDIYLYEHEVEKDEDGNLVSTGKKTLEDQSYHLYPAMTVTKDPTIAVKVDSEDAYIAAKIIITSGEAGDIEQLIYSKDHYEHLLDIAKIVSGGYAQPDQFLQAKHPLRAKYPQLPVYGDAEYGENSYAVFQQANENGGQYGKGEYVIYLFIEEPLAAGESKTLFNTITIPKTWDNAEMAIMNGTTIKVEAYATQTNGFHDCYTAITTAFPGAFPFEQAK